MARKISNIPASICARLQNVSRRKQTDFQNILVRYALERLLFRLSLSPYKDLFVLKGAMLYAVWLEAPHRMTRDLDLLSSNSHETESLKKIFREIFQQEVDEDGLVFDVEAVDVAAIRDDQMYGGVRLRTTARLDNAAIPVRIDIGFGDVVTPDPVEVEYPVLLDQPAPRINAYPRETVVAEKFEAMMALGLGNSRMKDLYDLFFISRTFSFNGAGLVAAVEATFTRRGTPMPDEIPLCLTGAFSENRQKIQQWQSFLAREALAEELNLEQVIHDLASFIMPVFDGVRDKGRTPKNWRPDTGWT